MSNKKVLVFIGTLFLLICVLPDICAFDTIREEKLYESNIRNPIDVELGDPYVLLASDGKYYMYGTDETGKIEGFSVYSSDNLVDWKQEGQVYKGNTASSWTLRNFWAPEVYERNGKFYMFFSADWKYNPTHEAENFRIGVAVSDKPTGPFRDLSDKPLFDPGYPVIDANILTYNGKTYLYYSRCCYKNPVKSEVSDWARKINLFQEIEESWIYGVEISSDYTSVIGEPVLLLQPPKTMNDKQSEWESRSVTSGEVNRRWTEGPFALARNNTIYLMYSANYFGGKNYAVGYATSSQPLGPFLKAPNNPILQKNTHRGGIVTGTGHNSVTYSKDGKSMYCVYHGRTSQTGDKRVVFIDKMKIHKKGLLVVDGPTTNKKAL
ncbi:MAG: glycoside hydrolase family 43 protein [Bacteroidota bacterium]|nr:glycoside hydrolase family 43 protein [Bacteroidota bacterium]